MLEGEEGEDLWFEHYSVDEEEEEVFAMDVVANEAEEGLQFVRDDLMQLAGEFH